METKLSYLGRNLVRMWCSRDRFMAVRDTGKADRYLPITLHSKQDKGRDRQTMDGTTYYPIHYPVHLTPYT